MQSTRQRNLPNANPKIGRRRMPKSPPAPVLPPRPAAAAKTGSKKSAAKAAPKAKQNLIILRFSRACARNNNSLFFIFFSFLLCVHLLFTCGPLAVQMRFTFENAVPVNTRRLGVRGVSGVVRFLAKTRLQTVCCLLPTDGKAPFVRTGANQKQPPAGDTS